MKLIIDTFKNSGNLHHAYLMEGEKDAIRNNLLDFIENSLKHPIQGNPDFWHERFDTFSIDDARKLREMQSVKPLVHKRKIFIAEVYSMTVEAQNALLKIFEEPTPGTHFFIIIDTAEILLPTLRSRMIVIGTNESGEGSKALAKKFMESTPPERIAMVGPIIEEKDKVTASGLIDGLIRELSKKPDAHASELKELLKLRGFLADRSPSLKLILEHISLILPTI
jgi:DNA polymerase III delta prime subunit